VSTHSPAVPVAAPPAVPAPRRQVPRRVRRRRLLVAIADHSILIAGAVAFLFPVVFMVLTALMTNDQALSTKLWPEPFRWGNFAEVFDKAPMLRYGLNTAIYSVLATLFMLLSSVPVAYALARLRWKGRDAVFLLVLVAMMLPPQVTIVPLYVMWAKLNLVGTLWPLILPNLFGDAFSIFLLRQFFLTIPESYLDAARVDGCGELRILVSVVCRLAKPALAAVALFMFLFTFSDFFGPLLYAGDEERHWTLSVGLAQFRTLHQVQWNLSMAATVMVLAPVVALFFLAQRAFVEGVTLTGVKE
jgi:multiple sugar transport system permease protein